jgi:hypothetical protein
MESNEVQEITSDNMAGDLLGGVMAEIRLLPDIWQKLSEHEQGAIIDRLKERITRNVRQAVKHVASAGRVCVVGDLKKVTMSDKCEAVFTLPVRDPQLPDLCEARGKACLIVIASSDEHMGGLDDVTADPRQMDLTDGAESIIKQAQRRARDAGKGDEAQGKGE